MLSSTERAERARIATLTRHHGKEAPDVVELRTQFKTARLARHIAEQVAAWPPLDQAQRDRLAILLRGGDAA